MVQKFKTLNSQKYTEEVVDLEIIAHLVVLVNSMEVLWSVAHKCYLFGELPATKSTKISNLIFPLIILTYIHGTHTPVILVQLRSNKAGV